MAYIMRDFVQSWYSQFSTDQEGLRYIELVLTHAIGVLVQNASTVQPLRFLCDDVCEALRYHLYWYSEMVSRAKRLRPGAFRPGAGAFRDWSRLCECSLSVVIG